MHVHVHTTYICMYKYMYMCIYNKINVPYIYMYIHVTIYFVGSCGPTHPSHPMISSRPLQLQDMPLKVWLLSNFQQMYMQYMYMYPSIYTCTVSGAYEPPEPSPNLLPGLVPAQLGSHDLHYPWQSLIRCLNIQEGQPCPPSKHVYHCAGILRYGVLYLSLNVGELLGETDADHWPPPASEAGQLGHFWGLVTVCLGQVLGYLRVREERGGQEGGREREKGREGERKGGNERVERGKTRNKSMYGEMEGDTRASRRKTSFPIWLYMYMHIPLYIHMYMNCGFIWR